jgi:hypothetical protein
MDIRSRATITHASRRVTQHLSPWRLQCVLPPQLAIGGMADLLSQTCSRHRYRLIMVPMRMRRMKIAGPGTDAFLNAGMHAMPPHSPSTQAMHTRRAAVYGVDAGNVYTACRRVCCRLVDARGHGFDLSCIKGALTSRASVLSIICLHKCQVAMSIGEWINIENTALV